MSKSIKGRKFSDEQVKALKAKFDAIDTDKSGTLEENEIEVFMKESGFDVSLSKLVFFVFSENNGISFKSFTRFLGVISSCVDDPLAIFRALFNKIDIDHNGSLDYEEFKLFNKLIGFEDTESETKELFEEADDDKNGSISFEEICNVLELV